MKSSEFIIENSELDEVWLNRVSSKKTNGDMSVHRDGERWDPNKENDEIFIAKLPGNNFLYRCERSFADGFRHYHLWNSVSKKSTISVGGRWNPKSRNLSGLLLASLNTNTVPAHIFYATIIKVENISLEANDQSIGAKKVWQKLAKVKGINIHGWVKGEPVNVSPSLDTEDEIYADDADGWDYDPKIRKTAAEIGPIRLIAHKA